LHKENILQLNRECAISNNMIKIGEVISDHIGTIKVEKLIVNHNTFGYSLPMMNYYGVMINKNGK